MKKNLCAYAFLLFILTACKFEMNTSEAAATEAPKAKATPAKVEKKAHKETRPEFASEPVNPSEDPGFMSHRRQITFTGPRSGEGYFSPDGKQMIYQSERVPGNPFYQIYKMNLETGESELLSTGQGKTTCSWFHPSMRRALFSSTHLDHDFKNKVRKEYEERNAPQKQRYSWSYDENFDIFEVDLKTKKLRQLTHEKGYDAEGSYSPDGRLIAFASNRAGYTEKLSAEDQKIFDKDPSYMADIYLMNANGTDVRRLTFEKGYDGGPFFSPDGKRITWRRFTPNGQSAEIMTMNLDGSAQKAITHLGAMSWAPFYHPSGDYIIFTTNKLGYSNFELYIVDAEGEHEPVRVSYIDGFDGLPVFSPDGKTLAWTHHNEKGESQIYMADWNDQMAREALGLQPVFLKHNSFIGHFSPEDARSIVEFLARDQMEGRMTGSPQEELYTQYLAELFSGFGLEPAGNQGFLQSFEFSSGIKLGPAQKLTATLDGKSKNAMVGEDYTPLSFSSTGDFGEAGVVFAGYGIVAPASESQPLYDSYANLDVKGKWVLAFRDIPENVSNPRRIHLNMYSRPHHKALVARERGARGIIFVNGPTSGAKDKMMKLRFDGAGFAGAGLPVLSVSDDLARNWVKPLGKSLRELQEQLDKGDAVANVGEIKGLNLQVRIDLEQEKSRGYNVLAKLRVPGATETVVVGAHGDHLGRGVTGSSLAQAGEVGRIHYGADDNASGVAGIVLLAQEWSKQVRAGKLKPKQNIIFAVWSGEEIGLLGSTHFSKRTTEKISAYLNMDMIGRLRDNLIIQGVASAKEWSPLFEKVAARTSVPLSLGADPYVPSDAMAFYMAGIPSIHFFTGSHAEYHTPRDIPSTLNYPGISQVVQVVHEVMKEATASKKPLFTYQKVESSHKNLEGRSFRIYLGTIPDYTQEGIKGVRISGTSKNSPAEKTGLKAGDVIVELASTKIENLYDYVYALQALKPNAAVPLKVRRGEKVEELQIVPQLKE